MCYNIAKVYGLVIRWTRVIKLKKKPVNFLVINITIQNISLSQTGFRYNGFRKHRDWMDSNYMLCQQITP